MNANPWASLLIGRCVLGFVGINLALMLLSCTSAGSEQGASSNLSPEDRARLEAWALDLQAEGALAPALPSYIPRGLDTQPTVIQAFEELLRFEFRRNISADQSPSMPLVLRIEEEAPARERPVYCESDPPLSEADLEGLGAECVKISGRPADLYEDAGNPTELFLTFHAGDYLISVNMIWDSEGEDIRRDILRVAESISLP